MFRVTKEIHFCYGHRLLNYAGKCRHLHGHNGRAVITLEADALDELGMVLDFSRLKRVVGGWIDETLEASQYGEQKRQRDSDPEVDHPHQIRMHDMPAPFCPRRLE